MENQILIAILYSLPLLGIVTYISTKPEYSISASVTWSMFVVSYVLSEMAGIVNGVIGVYTKTYLVSLILAAFNEEIFKFVMIVIFLQYFKKKINLIQSLFIGGTCCLAFAVSENWYYIVRDDLEVLPGIQALTRLVMPSPMHFITGSIIAIYAFQHYVKERSINNVFIGIAFGTSIHTIYNIGASYNTTFLMSFAVAIGVIIAFSSYKRMDIGFIEEPSTSLKTKHDKISRLNETKSKKDSKAINNSPKIVTKRKTKSIKIVQKKK